LYGVAQTRGYKLDPNGLPPLETYLEFGGLAHAKQFYLFLTYYDQDFTPVLTKQQRDHIIRQRHANGEAISDLAREFDITPQRVFQIVKLKVGT
jgi:Mor family transcriptional regulator